MNLRSLLLIVGAFGVLAGRALAGPVSITVNSNAGSPYALSTGTLLAPGSIIRIGQFDFSLPGNLTTVMTSDDFAAVDALFTPLAENIVNAGTVNQSGATGEYLIINDQFNTGDVYGQIIDIDSAYFTAGTELYAWVFNSSDPLTATEWGVYTASSGWEFPTDLSSSTLSTFEIDTVLRGTDTGTQFRLSAVPEAGSSLLALLGLTVFAVRRRRHRPIA